MSRPFEEQELEILILALRYWRAQRAPVARKTDPIFGPNEIDVLLAKLRGSLATDDHTALVSSTHADPN